MFPKVISTREEFDILKKQIIDHNATVAVPIFSDNNKHPAVNTLSILVLFVRNLKYILPFNHNEAICIPVDWLTEIEFGYCIVPCKKDALYFLKGNLIDSATIELYKCGQITDIATYRPEIWNNIKHKHHMRENVNRSVPLLKLLEYAENFRKDLLRYMSERDLNKSINDIIIPTLQYIEKQGLRIDEKKFIDKFGDKAIKSIVNGFVYSQYDPYTQTGRPSNSFNGINYLALNKSDGTREAFISRFDNGCLVLMDFESFHLRLIAHKIDFPQPAEPFHEYLGKQYAGVSHLTQEQYEEGKRLTFSYLYGERRPANPIPFFTKVYNWIDKFWETTQFYGFFKTDLDKSISLDSFFKTPDKALVFNYLIQSMESRVALSHLHETIPLFEKVKSKPILYTYDSILIDYCLDDGKDFLLNVKKELEGGYSRQYPVRIYYGPNYGQMKKITI